MGKGVVKLGDGNWAVKDGNLLAVKETNRRFKNTEFTVERGTRATYVGRDGLIKESDLQNTDLVLNGDYEELGSELVTNGDFSTAGTITSSSYSLGWTSPDNGLSISSGVLNIVRTSSGGRAYASNGSSGNLTITNGKTYKLTYTITENSDNSTLQYHNGGAYVNTSNSAPGTYTVTYVAAGTIFLLRNGGSNDTTIKIDNISVKQVDPNNRWTLGTGWSIEDGKAVCSSQSNNLTQNIGVTANKNYKLTVKVADYTSGTLFVDLGGATAQTTSSLGNKTFYFTTSSNASLRFYGGSFRGSIDNVIVQEIKTATPRIDFTNNTDGHLLLEPARTNILTNSQNLSSTSYPATRGTIDLSSVVSPDGLSYSYKLQANATGNNGTWVRPVISPAFNGAHTVSVFAKKGTQSFLQLRIDGVSAGVIFDLNTGVVKSETSATGSIESYLNGWYRCSASITASNSTKLLLLVGSENMNSSIWSVSSGDNIYLWGAQLEAGAYPTSYIPTAGATATRSADVCKNSGTVADFNSTEGVLFADIAALNSTTENQISICLSNSGGTDRLLLYFGASSNAMQAQFRKNSSTYVAASASVVKTNQNKVAMSWKSGKNVLFVNGVKATSYGTGSETTATTFDEGDIISLQFSPGKNFTSNYFFGKTKQLEVYKTGFSDDQLIRLTGTLGTHFFESYNSMAGALTYTTQ